MDFHFGYPFYLFLEVFTCLNKVIFKIKEKREEKQAMVIIKKNVRNRNLIGVWKYSFSMSELHLISSGSITIKQIKNLAYGESIKGEGWGGKALMASGGTILLNIFNNKLVLKLPQDYSVLQ